MGQPTWSASTQHPLPPGLPPYHFHPLSPPPAAHGPCVCLHCKTYTHDMDDTAALQAHLKTCLSHHNNNNQTKPPYLPLHPPYLLQRASAKALVATGMPFDMLERPEWVRLMDHVHPGSVTVTRRTVFEWLDSVVDELEREGERVDYKKIREQILEADERDVPKALWDPEGRYFRGA